MIRTSDLSRAAYKSIPELVFKMIDMKFKMLKHVAGVCRHPEHLIHPLSKNTTCKLLNRNISL